MSEWQVTLVTEASFTCTVEADSEEEALEKAHEQAPHSLCHAEPVEIGDWEHYEDNPNLAKQGMRSAELIEQ